MSGGYSELLRVALTTASTDSIKSTVMISSLDTRLPISVKTTFAKKASISLKSVVTVSDVSRE